MMENTEGSEGTPTKISDSAYSNSCGNSHSQRSGSSKSLHSGSNSSGSSGYGGKTSSTLTNSNEATSQPSSKRNKDKDHKKKQLKGGTSSTKCSNTPELAPGECISGTRNIQGIERQNGVDDNKPLTNLTATDLTPKNTDESSEDNLPACTDRNEKEVQNAAAGIEETSPANGNIMSAFQGEASNGIVNHGSSEEGSILKSPSRPVPDYSSSIVKQHSSPVNCQELSTTSEGFSCIVSMCDGVVLCTNNALTASLGYPKDMWLGRSFIDFVHTKDQATFTNQISSRVVLPQKEGRLNETKEIVNPPTLFCRIRRYRGLKIGTVHAGFGVRERESCFSLFQLTLTLRDMTKFENQDIYLIITAIPIASAYVDNYGKQHCFMTRHTSMGILSHMSPEAVSHLGYLPQDIIGQSVFDFYHPEDMSNIKEIYETILQRENSFQSRPYRFCAQNGDYLLLETEWSSFVNPWSRKLEFIVGRHKVLQGPLNVDIFAKSPKGVNKYLSEEYVLQSKTIQEEIIRILGETVKISEMGKHIVSKRCKELATFIENLMEDKVHSDEELKLDIVQETSISEQDSVMLGEISPHHDYSNSKSSTETLPNYNQLNYNENLNRFFESRPKTFENIDDKNTNSKLQSEKKRKWITQVHGSQEKSGNSESSGNSYKKPNYSRHMTKYLLSSRTCNNTSQPNYKPTHLTEELLNKHNCVMERIMAKKHREARSVSKAERDKAERKDTKNCAFKNNSGHQNSTKNFSDSEAQTSLPNSHNHGIKRPGSISWDEDENSHKLCKIHSQSSHATSKTENYYLHTDELKRGTDNQISTPSIETPATTVELQPQQILNSMPIAGLASTTYPGIYPAVYLLPAQQSHQPHEISGPPKSTSFPVQYMMYPPTLFGTQPFIYPPMAMAYQPMPMTPSQLPSPSVIPASNKPIGLPFDNYQQACQETISATEIPEGGTSTGSGAAPGPGIVFMPKKFIQPCSRDTSLKVEPSSGIQSPTSNRLLTPLSEHLQTDRDVSSYSSFYSSFLKTEASNSATDESGVEINHRKRKYPTDNLFNKHRPCNTKNSNGVEWEKISNNSHEDITSSNEMITNKELDFSLDKSYTEIISQRKNTPNIVKTNNKNIVRNFSMMNRNTLNETTLVSKNPTCELTNANKKFSYDSANLNNTMTNGHSDKPTKNVEPPWEDKVCVTSELIYKYQLVSKCVEDVLKSDLDTLISLNQPVLVNEQLSQLYVELQLEGLSSKLTLEEGITSSSEDDTNQMKNTKWNYNKLVKIYEEDSPIPPPINDK